MTDPCPILDGAKEAVGRHSWHSQQHGIIHRGWLSLDWFVKRQGTWPSRRAQAGGSCKTAANANSYPTAALKPGLAMQTRIGHPIQFEDPRSATRQARGRSSSGTTFGKWNPVFPGPPSFSFPPVDFYPRSNRNRRRAPQVFPIQLAYLSNQDDDCTASMGTGGNSGPRSIPRVGHDHEKAAFDYSH
jgi:hypothetical protein